jgi:hypothetical protein
MARRMSDTFINSSKYLLSKEQKVQECDARNDDSSNADGNKKEEIASASPRKNKTRISKTQFKNR